MWMVFSGCAPGAFTSDEAHDVFAAVSSVNADTYAALYAVAMGGVEPAATADGLTWHPEADGGRFEGTLEGPGSWTGLVELGGAYTVSLTGGAVTGIDWVVDAAYVDVVYGPLRLDADLTWAIQAETDGSRATHASTVAGDIVARGHAVGAGALDYVTTVTLSGGRYQVETRGTVGGQDISASYDATAYAL